MSAADREDRTLRPSARARGDHERAAGRIEPCSPLGLTDEGRRVVAALKALNLLPKPPDDEPGSGSGR
jgi:hypothetical protein